MLFYLIAAYVIASYALLLFYVLPALAINWIVRRDPFCGASDVKQVKVDAARNAASAGLSYAASERQREAQANRDAAEQANREQIRREQRQAWAEQEKAWAADRAKGGAA